MHRQVFCNFSLQMLRNQDRMAKNMWRMELVMGFVGRPLPVVSVRQTGILRYLQKINAWAWGLIIRDGDGQISAAKSATIFANFDPAAREALAALHAVEFYRDLGIFEVILEGDSVMVTRALEEKGENWLRYGQIVEDTKSVLRSFRQWKIS